MFERGMHVGAEVWPSLRLFSRVRCAHHWHGSCSVMANSPADRDPRSVTKNRDNMAKRKAAAGAVKKVQGIVDGVIDEGMVSATLLELADELEGEAKYLRSIVRGQIWQDTKSYAGDLAARILRPGA